mgnify:CR=1 FL=1
MQKWMICGLAAREFRYGIHPTEEAAMAVAKAYVTLDKDARWVVFPVEEITPNASA